MRITLTKRVIAQALKEVMRLFDDPAAVPASEGGTPAKTDSKSSASGDMKYVPRIR